MSRRLFRCREPHLHETVNPFLIAPHACSDAVVQWRPLYVRVRLLSSSAPPQASSRVWRELLSITIISQAPEELPLRGHMSLARAANAIAASLRV